MKKTRLKPVSKKRAERLKTYSELRKEFLKGKRCPVTGEVATEIHHTNGRENERLNDVEFWLAVSREGHEKIHRDPRWARENGFLI
jgi:hypothetical protein